MYMENASGINNKIPGLSGKSRKARAGCHELRVGRRNARATLRLLDQEGDENCSLSCLRIKTAKSRTKIGRGNLNLNQRLFWSSYVATCCTCLTSVCVPPHGSHKSALFRLLAGEAVAAGIGQQIYTIPSIYYGKSTSARVGASRMSPLSMAFPSAGMCGSSCQMGLASFASARRGTELQFLSGFRGRLLQLDSSTAAFDMWSNHTRALPHRWVRRAQARVV